MYVSKGRCYTFPLKRYSNKEWDTSIIGLHREAIQEHLSSKPRQAIRAPWERLSIERLFVALNAMVVEGNYVCYGRVNFFSLIGEP